MVPGRRSDYRIKARNAAGLGPQSDYVNVRAPMPPFVEVSFDESSYTIEEGSAATITITLSADPERTVAVPVSRNNQGDATDDDLTGVPASVSFDSGDTQATFTVAATDDTEDDDGEGVTLTIGTLPARVSAGSTAETTVSITDNDAAEVQVQSPRPSRPG